MVHVYVVVWYRTNVRMVLGQCASGWESVCTVRKFLYVLLDTHEI